MYYVLYITLPMAILNKSVLMCTIVKTTENYDVSNAK